MKKVLVLFLLLLTFARAEPLIVKDKDIVVGDRTFSYYCIDYKLYLESYYNGHRSSGSINQVYATTASNVPISCSYNLDGNIHYNNRGEKWVKIK